MAENISESSNESIVPDPVSLNDNTRLALFKKIHACEMKGKLLDTSVVDQVLSTFGSKQCCVLPTFTMEEGSGSPY